MLDAAVEFADSLLGAGFLALQRFTRDDKALQAGGGSRLGFAQGRQPGGDLRLAGRSLRLLASARRDDADGFILGMTGFADFGLRGDPAQVEKERLGAADLA